MVEQDKDFAACYNKALDLLSRRAHFTAELRRKLQTRKFESDDIEEALRRLTERSFLDDREAARQFVVARQRRLGEVGVRLIQELRKRGVDPDLAGAVVAEMEGEEEATIAARMAARLLDRGATADKVARHLTRKGFSKAVILDVLPDA